MLNILWPFFIVSSFIYAIFTGRVEEANNAVFESTSGAVTLTLTLLRNNVLMDRANENSF